jgi:hypothetical protein
MLEPELYVMGASGGVYALLISQLANILLVSKGLFVLRHCCLASSPTLNMEALYFSKRSVNFHRTIRCHVPEDHCRENLKSRAPVCNYRAIFLKCLGICLFTVIRALARLVSKIGFISAGTLAFEV